MNTPTHLLIGAAILAKPSDRTALQDRSLPWRNWAVLAGALMPDLALLLMFAWMRGVEGVSEAALWRDVYWQAGWQRVFAIGNSAPLYVLLLTVAWLARERLFGKVLGIFALAALIHLAFDLPFHHDDAHRHFWPLSDWRFHSPLSYWNPDQHGDIVGLIETILAVGLIALLWRRFRGNRWVAGSLAVALISYVAVPAYFAITLGGS